MAKNIKLIRLTTGEELLGEIVLDTGLKLTVKNPIRIVVMPSKGNPQQPTIGFAPWMEFAEEKEFVLDNSHVLCIMTPIKEFVTQYNASFSGLVVPQNNLVVPTIGPP